MWQYKVIVSDLKEGMEDFEDTVSEYLNAGWKLVGGIVVDSELCYVLQAVYKYE